MTNASFRGKKTWWWNYLCVRSKHVYYLVPLKFPLELCNACQASSVQKPSDHEYLQEKSFKLGVHICLANERTKVNVFSEVCKFLFRICFDGNDGWCAYQLVELSVQGHILFPSHLSNREAWHTCPPYSCVHNNQVWILRILFQSEKCKIGLQSFVIVFVCTREPILSILT